MIHGDTPSLAAREPGLTVLVDGATLRGAADGAQQPPRPGQAARPGAESWRTSATASMVTEFNPMLAVALGLMTGGVAAEGVHLTKAKARLMSTAFTGSIANPILSVLEDIASFIGVIMAVLVPFLVLGGAFGFVLAVWLWRRRRRPQPAV